MQATIAAFVFAGLGLYFLYGSIRSLRAVSKGSYEVTNNASKGARWAIVFSAMSGFLFWVYATHAVEVLRWFIFAAGLLTAGIVLGGLRVASKDGEKRIVNAGDNAFAALIGFLMAIGFFYIAASTFFFRSAAM